MYLVKTPSIIKPVAGELVWSIPSTEREVYLTFDDGPTPGVTDKALDLLQSHAAKATFFCLGKNVEAHPELYQRILAEGHRTGNHTWDHPDGWKTPNFSYYKNLIRTEKFVQSNLFRPPYGRISLTQSRSIRKKYTIVMWSVLSADFDRSITPDECLNNVIRNTEAGSIVVFHDSVKARRNMLYALEASLNYFQEEGYTLRALPPL